jgi:hypothetical protein
MDGFSLFEYIAGKLEQGCAYTAHASKNVYVKTDAVGRFYKKDDPFLNKREIRTEGKVRNGIVDEEQAEKEDGQPEQDQQANLFGALQCGDPCVHDSNGIWGLRDNQRLRTP